MQVEDVARIGFTSRRTTQQQGDLAISPGLLGQVVVDDEGVFTAVAEVFAHRGAGVRSDVLHGGRFGSRGGHDDRVGHGAGFFELANDVRNRRGLLADGDVNADEVLALLVDDRVDGHGGLTRLTVTNDQFALAASDRHHGVDGLQTRLNRLRNRLTINHARGDLFHHVVFFRLDRALAVDRLTEGVDHAADQSAADGNGKNALGGLDHVAFGNVFVITENNGTDGIALKVESQAVGVVGEFQHFALHHVAETVNTANTVGHRNYGALGAKISGNAEAFDTLLQQIADFTRIELHLTAPNFLSGEHRFHLLETGADRRIDHLVADRYRHTADQFGINTNDGREFHSRELRCKLVQKPLELFIAELEGRLDVDVGDALGQILQFMELTSDFRHHFQTIVFHHHSKKIRGVLGKGAATSILDQIEKLIVSQFRIAHQRGDLRVLLNGTNRLQRLEHLRHFISAGLTFLKGLHETRSVGARNRRKFSHNQSFAFNCSSN